MPLYFFGKGYRKPRQCSSFYQRRLLVSFESQFGIAVAGGAAVKSAAAAAATATTDDECTIEAAKLLNAISSHSVSLPLYSHLPLPRVAVSVAAVFRVSGASK